jgi:hypothetical protein
MDAFRTPTREELATCSHVHAAAFSECGTASGRGIIGLAFVPSHRWLPAWARWKRQEPRLWIEPVASKYTFMSERKQQLHQPTLSLPILLVCAGWFHSPRKLKLALVLSLFACIYTLECECEHWRTSRIHYNQLMLTAMMCNSPLISRFNDQQAF